MGTSRPGPPGQARCATGAPGSEQLRPRKVPRPARAAPRGRTRRPGPHRTERDPAPAGRPPAPFPLGPAPSQAYNPPQPPTPRFQRSGGSGRGRPHPAFRKGGANAGQAEPAGRAAEVHAGPRGGRPEPAPSPPAQPARPARGHLLLGPPTSRLPPGGKRKLSRRLPSGPPRLPDLRGAAAEPGGRQRSRSRPSVRPVARSSSSVHYIIFSFSEGWAGAAGSGRKETFASFLHPPPPSQP